MRSAPKARIESYCLGDADALQTSSRIFKQGDAQEGSGASFVPDMGSAKGISITVIEKTGLAGARGA
jgi:hypothetical protein